MGYIKDLKIVIGRIIDSVQLGQDWKDIEDVYGSKTAKRLKKLTPIDPLLLHDMMVTWYEAEGKTKKEIEKMLRKYTAQDLSQEMDHFENDIERIQNETRKRIREEIKKDES